MAINAVKSVNSGNYCMYEKKMIGFNFIDKAYLIKEKWLQDFSDL